MSKQLLHTPEGVRDIYGKEYASGRSTSVLPSLSKNLYSSCEDAGLDEETETDLRAFISGKNYFAAQELLEESVLSTTTQKPTAGASFPNW